LTTINTCWEATQMIVAAELTRLTHKIAIQLHLVAESCTIRSSRSRRPVRKLLDTPSYFLYIYIFPSYYWESVICSVGFRMACKLSHISAVIAYELVVIHEHLHICIRPKKWLRGTDHKYMAFNIAAQNEIICSNLGIYKERHHMLYKNIWYPPKLEAIMQ
jgi:hypothetical protein